MFPPSIIWYLTKDIYQGANQEGHSLSKLETWQKSIHISLDSKTSIVKNSLLLTYPQAFTSQFITVKRIHIIWVTNTQLHFITPDPHHKALLKSLFYNREQSPVKKILAPPPDKVQYINQVIYPQILQYPTWVKLDALILTSQNVMEQDMPSQYCLFL